MKLILGICSIVVLTTSLSGASISNGDFEAQAGTLSNDGNFAGSATGWTVSHGSNQVGVFNPSEGVGAQSFSPGQAGGVLVAFAANSGRSLSQSLTGENSTLTAGITYNLQVRVGQRRESVGTSNYEVALVANGNTQASKTHVDNPLTTGEFTTVNLSFTPNGGNGDLGNTVSIRLLNTGTGQIAFDDVTISAVPEPTTYALISGLGLVGMAAYRRHKLRKA